ncbi:long-chain-fatty-acid--CoA ligase [Frankia sp. AgPm24]|uniref:long-chain-fatty-acid--CoA ligase n=1 Tax=Frankia sp. AgPm24 TaxID=631128 RepID=UPI00200D9833|nr:long-chain-fatty-acid--CoA ligase [Frankia sp. AgPm24]MCK9923356.1 long-chain-fatty-acid--CoA ligase [Frankia sp. AgPm24]
MTARPETAARQRTVAELVTLHAARQPRTAAILCAGRTMDYEHLDRESNRTARAILARGIAPGGRVAYLGRESEHYYEIFVACAKAGTVLVPINWRLTVPEIEHILADSACVLLFVTDELRATAERATAEHAGLEIVVVDGEGDGGPDGCPELAVWKAPHPAESVTQAGAGGPDDPVVQLYTSGTTGLPKGVVLAHRSLHAVREALAGAGLDWIDWRPGDRALVGIPGFHVGGIWWAAQNLSAGVTNVVLPAFDGRTAVRLIRDLGVTTACVVPSMLRIMLAEPEANRTAFQTLRKVVYGGSPISESLLRESLEVFDCEFAQIYGLTETGNTAVCLPPADHRPDSPRLRAAGRPYPGIEAKTIGPDGATLPTGEVGEICLSTPARMIGYWNLPEETTRTLVDGWVHTGDAGRVDADGYVYILDRVKDLIIVAGENIYPNEIENALAHHPAVADVAVIGVPDDRFGEAVQAFVALCPGHSARARDLVVFLTGRIATFKIPARFAFVERIPRNPSGKILRRELRAPYWSGRDRQVN